MKQIKNKKLLFLGIIVVLLGVIIGYILWSKSLNSQRLCRINADKVKKIEISSIAGSIEIVEKQSIQRLIESWNDVRIKKEKSARGYTGVNLSVEIYMENGEMEDFLIQSENLLVKDTFFCNLVEGSIEYDYIKEMTEAEDEKELVSRRIDVDKVEKIEIFDGDLGAEVEITKESDIERLMDSWRAVCMKKEKSSEGYAGEEMSICIYQEQSGYVEEFNIRSEDKVEKDGVFYEVEHGSTEYEYIRELTKAQAALDEQR